MNKFAITPGSPMPNYNFKYFSFRGRNRGARQPRMPLFFLCEAVGGTYCWWAEFLQVNPKHCKFSAKVFLFISSSIYHVTTKYLYDWVYLALIALASLRENSQISLLFFPLWKVTDSNFLYFNNTVHVQLQDVQYTYKQTHITSSRGTACLIYFIIYIYYASSVCN